ncbi:hypothetical protein ACFRK5_10920 [Streptomyces niveus]|uniref:hypothetical protein n=1 Tax=Streptomyces niveus TaxID=193462 RepID=UPI0036CC1E97
MLLRGVLTLVLALVAGLLALGGHGSGADAQQARTERNLRPFKEAIEDLADAPGLRYKDTSTLGITENDITVTAGGKKFTRRQADPAPRKDMAAGEKAPPSEWIVGLDDGSELMDEALARTIAPPKRERNTRAHHRHLSRPPAGDEGKPHRVLRLEAYDLREYLSDLRDQLENGEEPTAPRTVTTGPWRPAAPRE